MKKVFAVAVVALAGVMIFASCGKKCVCTRYEDGKKIVATNSDNTRYFDKGACTQQSVSSYQGYSYVTDGKLVDVEIKCK